jgi:hypothetical protein
MDSREEEGEEGGELGGEGELGRGLNRLKAEKSFPPSLPT